MKRTSSFRFPCWAALLSVCFVLMLMAPRAGYATHIVGGQLQMTHVTGSTYTFGLTLYFDLANGSTGARDGNAVLAIYDKDTNALRDTIVVPLVDDSPVVYTNPDCAINSLQTSELTYRRTFTLNAARYTSARGYYLVWERCCRNNIITNLIYPGSTGQTFYLEFPALRRNGQPFINSSPEGFQPIADYACVGNPFLAAFGGTDPDGDSLVYDLVTPLRGNSDTASTLVRPVPPRSAPYRRVRWLAGYDSLHQITGSAPLQVDRRTGNISFTAGQPGLFVFAVRCTEYRDGVRIGEARREFQQLVVGSCNNAPTGLSLSHPGAPNLPYANGTLLTLPNPPADRCLNLYATDGDLNARIFLRLVPLQPLSAAAMPSLSATSGVVNNGAQRDTLLARLCFNDCFGRDGSENRFYLIAEDEDCPIPHRDTVLLVVRTSVIPDTRPTLQMAPAQPFVTVLPGNTASIDITGADQDFDTRVTVLATNLTTAALARLPISCPTVSGENLAQTRLSWPVACGTPPGDYEVRLRTISEACGRTLTRDSSVWVRVLPIDTVWMTPPNIFTPNNDGLNDAFQPGAGMPPLCGQEFRRLRIFNRWGREVFASANLLATWEGKGVGEGLYYYYLEYTDRTYKGWVSLMR